MATQTSFSLRGETVNTASCKIDVQHWFETTFTNLVQNIDARIVSAFNGINVKFDLGSFYLSGDEVYYTLHANSPTVKTYSNRIRCTISCVIRRFGRSRAIYTIELGGRKQPIPKTVVKAAKGTRDVAGSHRFYYDNADDILHDIDIFVKQKMHLISRNNTSTNNQIAREANDKLNVELAAISVPAMIDEVLQLEGLTNDIPKRYRDGYSWRPTLTEPTAYKTEITSDHALITFCHDTGYLNFQIKLTPKGDECEYRLFADERIACEHSLTAATIDDVTEDDKKYESLSSEIDCIVARSFDTYQSHLTETQAKLLLQRLLRAEKLATTFLTELDTIAPYSFKNEDV